MTFRRYILIILIILVLLAVGTFYAADRLSGSLSESSYLKPRQINQTDSGG